MNESSFIDEMDDMDLFIEAPEPMQITQPDTTGLLARIEELCISEACQ